MHAPVPPWDLVVVGAGPAGYGGRPGRAAVRPGPAGAAASTRPTSPATSACGDGIAPHAVDALAEVGGRRRRRRLGARWSGSSCAGGDRVVRDDGTAGVGDPARPSSTPASSSTRCAPAPGWGATGSGRLARRRRRSVRAGRRTRARVVVGADGAHSVVRAALADPPPGRRRALAIRGYARPRRARRGRQVIATAPAASPSYAWAFDRGRRAVQRRATASCSAGADGPPSRADAAATSSRSCCRARAPTGTDWRGHHLPLSGWRWPQPDGRCPARRRRRRAGQPDDRRGHLLRGRHRALAGRAAAAALLAGRPAEAGARYRRRVRGAAGAPPAPHLGRRHPGPAPRPGRRRGHPRRGRATSDVFDDLVEIGLAGGRITPRLGVGLAGQLLRARVATTWPTAARPARRPTRPTERPPRPRWSPRCRS